MDDATLIGMAEAATADLLTEIHSDLEGMDAKALEALLGLLKPALIIAWIDGRQAGGDEAKKIVGDVMAQWRRYAIRALNNREEQ